MGIKEFLNYANSVADDIELFTTVITPESILKSNAEDYKKVEKVLRYHINDSCHTLCWSNVS